LAWWHKQNGTVTDACFGTRSLGGRYFEESESAESGFEIPIEMTIPFVNKRTDFKAALMFDTYDPDAFRETLGRSLGELRKYRDF
jgi:hypothetical protein